MVFPNYINAEMANLISVTIARIILLRSLMSMYFMYLEVSMNGGVPKKESSWVSFHISTH